MKKIVPTTPVALSTRTMKQVTPKPFMLILLVVPTVLVTTDLKGLVSPVKILTNVIALPISVTSMPTVPIYLVVLTVLVSMVGLVPERLMVAVSKICPMNALKNCMNVIQQLIALI